MKSGQLVVNVHRGVKSWIPKRFPRFFSKKEADRETQHILENLPVKEKALYIRNLQKPSKRFSGFDWEDTGKSMAYQSERGARRGFRHLNFGWLGMMNSQGRGAKNQYVNWDIYNETERESRILYTMRGEADLLNWDMMTDENMGGTTRCKMKLSDNGLSLCWFGILDASPPELDWGRTSNWKSFASLYTKKWERDYGRPDKISVWQMNCFEIRLRGDGRKYEFDVMGTRNWEDAQSVWVTSIFTKGGYEWETIRIPFYHFFQQHKDAKVQTQTSIPVDDITGFRFRIQDHVQGPFKLEIDYIATTYDFEFKTFTNETYRISKEDPSNQKNWFHSQSLRNHYYFDAYNPPLKRTNNIGQDTTARRLDADAYGRNPH